METSLSDPISAECPAARIWSTIREYLLLFTRAAPREEAQYGDFVSTPETINWAELERDARRLLMRSKDIRILVVLLRCRIQQAGAQGLADALALLETLCATYPDAIHPQLLATEDITAEEAAVARSNARWRRCWTMKVSWQIFVVSRCQIVSPCAFRYGMWSVRCLPHVRRMRWHRNRYASNWPIWKRAAHCPLDAFRRAAETTERLQRHARETLNDRAPDFSRLTQLLTLLPGAVQTTTQEIPSQPQAIQPESAAINNREPVQAEYVAPPANIAAEMTMKLSAEPRQIRDRNDALERLRVIRRWFEHSEPSSPTIPLLRQAERLVGKRFGGDQ